jgi:hypothetical protein
MKTGPFDNLEAIEVSEEEATAIAKRAARNGRRQFVKFPVEWMDRLRATKRASTYQVALYLLHRHWRTDGRPITLSNVAVQGIGVSAFKKWRALAELERAGLIEVERRARKSPIVKLTPGSV